MSDLFDPESWSWLRLCVRLRNIRKLGPTEHPLFVLRALIYSARAVMSGEKPGHEDFRFRVTSATGDQIQLGREYELYLLFRIEDVAKAISLGDALRNWTSDPAHNFECVAMELPERRTLAKLRSESPLDLGSREVCLDFHTPFAINNRPSSGRLALTAEKMHEKLSDRTRKIMGPQAITPSAADVRVWCHFLHTCPSRPHRKNSVENELLHGRTGPLFLTGDWQIWEPWIRLCSEWLLGSGTTKSQGAYKLRQIEMDDRDDARIERHSPAPPS